MTVPRSRKATRTEPGLQAGGASSEIDHVHPANRVAHPSSDADRRRRCGRHAHRMRLCSTCPCPRPWPAAHGATGPNGDAINPLHPGAGTSVHTGTTRWILVVRLHARIIHLPLHHQRHHRAVHRYHCSAAGSKFECARHDHHLRKRRCADHRSADARDAGVRRCRSSHTTRTIRDRQASGTYVSR